MKIQYWSKALRQLMIIAIICVCKTSYDLIIKRFILYERCYITISVLYFESYYLITYIISSIIHSKYMCLVMPTWLKGDLIYRIWKHIPVFSCINIFANIWKRCPSIKWIKILNSRCYWIYPNHISRGFIYRKC